MRTQMNIVAEMNSLQLNLFAKRNESIKNDGCQYVYSFMPIFQEGQDWTSIHCVINPFITLSRRANYHIHSISEQTFKGFVRVKDYLSQLVVNLSPPLAFAIPLGHGRPI